MKKTISGILVIFAVFQTIGGCKSNSSSDEIKTDSITSIIDSSIKTPSQLYSEGMGFLDERLAMQSSNIEKAMELNEQAIKKFSEAHKMDTSFRDPVFFASECTMYARDYKECIFWTTKLERIDTSSKNLTFCAKRIEYCKEKLKSKTEK